MGCHYCKALLDVVVTIGEVNGDLFCNTLRFRPMMRRYRELNLREGQLY